MKEKFLPFILKFIAVSLILFVFWFWKGENYYFLFFNSMVSPLLKIFGINLLPLPILYAQFNIFLPFTSLLLITPGIKPQKKLQKLLLGLFLIFLWQILTAVIFFLFLGQLGNPDEDPSSVGFALYFFICILNYSIPFVLWLILARKNLYTWFTSK
jgi:hypothetical protein